MVIIVRITLKTLSSPVTATWLNTRESHLDLPSMTFPGMTFFHSLFPGMKNHSRE